MKAPLYRRALRALMFAQSCEEREARGRYRTFCRTEVRYG